MGEGWDQLLVKMKSLKVDLPFHIFLEKYFRGDHFIKLRKSATRFAEGFDLADLKTASTMALIREWEHEESAQYRVPEGYGTLTSAMENEFKGKGGKIFLNHPIESIDWNSEKIILVLKDDIKFNIDKLMISLPLGVLNRSAPSSESIVFLPAIEEKQKAFGQIGFGTVVKIIMIWDTAFWKYMVPDALFIFSDCFIPTWWTQFPLDLPILTGWLGGPRAEQVADEPDEFFRNKAIDSLASIFFVSTDEIKKGLKECRIFNWKNEPWSRGAYSYSLVGSGDAKAICRKSLQKRIYFSGEAYYEGPYPGTVEAAVVSGLQSARQMISDMKG
jgi:monoamine oxidase